MSWNELQNYLDSALVKEERGILKAKYCGGHLLEIWFEEERGVAIFELDFAPILMADDTGDALVPLRDPARFSQVIGRYNLMWNDPDTGDYNESAIDLAPEAVRWFCENLGRAVNGTARDAKAA